MDTNTASDNKQEDTTTTATTKPQKVMEDDEPEFLSAEPKNWGSYYDPQQEFCGKYDCYRILGFDYESYQPDTKEIQKRYRRLSRKWHPDKNKHAKAKERFVVSLSRGHFPVPLN